MLRNILVTGIFLIIGYRACLQQLPYSHFSVENGLPHATVFRIHQQASGLIWFGTDAGLCRFDGSTFRSFTFGDSIRKNSVLALTDYSRDTLLVYLFREGLFLFHNERLMPYMPEIPGMEEILFAKKDAEGRTWLVNKKLRAGYIGNGVFHPFPIMNGKNALSVCTVFESLCGTVYFGTSDGMYGFRDRRLFPVHSDILAGKTVRCITQGADSTIFIEASGAIYKLHRGQCTFLRHCTGSNHSKLLLTNDNKLYHLSQSGILSVSDTAVFEQFLNKLIQEPVCDALSDQEGNIWLSTLGNGIYFVPHRQLLLVSAVESKVVFETDAGDILLGHLGGYTRLTGGDISQLHSVDLNPEDQVAAFLEMTADTLMVGTSRATYMAVNDKPVVLSDIFGAFQLHEDTHGDIYSCHSGALPLSASEVKYPLLLLNPLLRVEDMLGSPDGKLWLATYHGVFCLDSNSIEVFTTGEGLSDNFIHDLYRDHEGVLWVATHGGLDFLDGKTWRQVPIRNNCVSPPCQAITEDRHHRLWTGTSAGIYVLQEGELSPVHLPLHQPLIDVRDLEIDRSDRLWIATVGGVYNLHLDALSTHTLPPPGVYIDNIYLSGIRIGRHRDTILPYSANQLNLNIGFGAIAFKNPHLVRIQYRLAGFSDQWIETTQKEAIYHSLPPGRYTFEVRAYNEGSERFSPAEAFVFRISTPFFMQPWFYALAFVTSALLFIYWFRSRLKKHRRQLETENQLNALRHQALNAMMNPHFISNTLQSIQYYVKNHGKLEANEYIAGFSRLIRISLEMAPRNHITLEEELERLKLYLSMEKKRLGDMLNYDIHIDPQIDAEEVEVPNMIIQPFAENAIWHGILPKGSPGMVHISISQLEDILEVTVQDDGVGISETPGKLNGKSHTSMGSALVIKKLKLLNTENSIDISSVKEAADGRTVGTRVTIRVKV